MAQSRGKLILAFATVYIVWGSTYLAIRYAIATIPPFFMAGIRFILAGGILYIWAKSQGEPHPTKLHWRNALIIGALLLLMGNGGVVWAEQTVPSGLVALLVATVPLWLVLLNWIRPSGKRPGWGVIFGILVGLAGMAELIGIRGLESPNVPLAGTTVLILSSLAWAAGSLFARTADMPHTLMGTAIEMLCGGGLLLLLSAGSGEIQTLDAQAISLQSILALTYLLIFGSIIAYTAYSWLLRHASPAAIGTYAYVNPVIALLLGWLIADESITHQMLIGAGIIIGAVIIITTAQTKSARRSATLPAVSSNESS